MFTTFLIALAVIVFFVVVALRPSEFRVTRTASITATPATLFDQINDFHKWEAWSPWAKLDPAARNSFEGKSAGTGDLDGRIDRTRREEHAKADARKFKPAARIGGEQNGSQNRVAR
jgi:hypothetical protein